MGHNRKQRGRSPIKRQLAAFALLLTFFAPSFLLLIPVSYASTSEPLVESSTKLVQTITAPQYLFNGQAVGSVSVTYSFKQNKMQVDYANPAGDNFTIKGMTFDGKKIIQKGLYSNSTTFAYSLNKTGSVFSGWVYFVKKTSNGYPSPDLKVTIDGVSETGGNLCMEFANPNSKNERYPDGMVKRLLFGRLGFDYGDSLAFSPNFIMSERTLCWSVGTTFTIDPVTIGSSAINEGVSYPNQRNIVFANTRWWFTDSDGTNCQIWSSTDGTTWNGPATLSSATGCAIGFELGTALSGNNLYYAVNPNSGTTFTIGAVTLNSDGTTTSLVAETAITATNSPNNFASVAFDSGGNWWVAIQTSVAGPTYHIEAWKCAGTCTNTANWSDKKDITLSSGQNAPIILALTSGVALLYSYATGTSTTACILTSATGASWTACTATTSKYEGFDMSATANGDNVYFVGWDAANTNIKSWTCAYPCSSTPSEVVVESTTNANWWVTVSYDSSTSSLAAIYGDATNIYYRTSTDGGATWSASTTIASGLSPGIPVGTNLGGRAATSPLSTSSGTVAAGWEEGNSNPYNVRFTTVQLTVTQPITITVDNSGPSGTATLSGCSVSPTTEAMDGTQRSFTANPSCTITVTMPSDGASSRYRTASSATTYTIVTCASDTCSVSSTTVYNELKQTWKITAKGASTLDASMTCALTGTLAGTGSTTLSTFAPSTNASSTASSTYSWADYNRQVSFCSTLTGAPTSTQWAGATPLTFTQTTGGNTNNVDYWKQGSMTSSYSITDALGVCSAPTLTYNSLGSQTTYSLTTTGTAKFIDWGNAPTTTNPLAGSTTSERCVTTFSMPAVSAGGTINPAYKHQAQLNNPGSLSITRTNNGTSAVTTSTAFFCDVTTVVTISGTYPFNFNCATSVLYVNQEGSQGFVALSNVAITSLAYAQNPNRLTYVGTASTNVTVFEATALQNSLGGVSKFYSNGNSITTYTWSSSSGFFVSGSVSCTTNCELDFLLGGGSPSGGGGTPTSGGTTSSGGGGGGGGVGYSVSGCPVNEYLNSQGQCVPVPANSGNYVPASVGNPNQLTIGLVSLLGILALIGVVRYLTRETDLQKLGKSSSGKILRVPLSTRSPRSGISAPEGKIFHVKLKRSRRLP